MPQAVPVLSAIGGGSALAGAATVIGAGATVASISVANRAARTQREAAAVQQRIQQQQVTRQRRQAIRANIMRRSQLQAQAQAMGVAGTSMVSGGLSGLSSQLGANLGYGSMMSGLGQQYTGLTAQAAQLGAQSQLYGTIGSIGFGVAQRAPQITQAAQGVQNIAGAAMGIPQVGKITF